jgi:hypothetical protein
VVAILAQLTKKNEAATECRNILAYIHGKFVLFANSLIYDFYQAQKKTQRFDFSVYYCCTAA